MNKKESFSVKSSGETYYAFIEDTDDYLFKPGILANWFAFGKEHGYKEANERAWFLSREELEKCLDIYLKGQEMDYSKRIAQCNKDIAALNVERNKLLEEKEKKNDPHYNIKKYIQEHGFYGKKTSLININHEWYIGVPLPSANDLWTFAAFDWVKTFCKRFDGNPRSVYPIHYGVNGFDNANYLYISIGKEI